MTHWDSMCRHHVCPHPKECVLVGQCLDERRHIPVEEIDTKLPPVTSNTTYHEPPGEARKSAESATKPRLELLPFAALTEIAEVLTFGAEKYDANNWCRGARWGRYFAALCRHVFAWWGGENLDPETGKSHLAHAGCCLLFLMEYQRNGWGEDDRFTGPDTLPFKKSDNVQQQQRPVFVPNPIFNPRIQWSTGTDIQDSDGFSHWDAAE